MLNAVEHSKTVLSYDYLNIIACNEILELWLKKLI